MKRAVVFALMIPVVCGLVLCACDKDDDPAAPAPADPGTTANTVSGTFIIDSNPDLVNGNPSTDTFDPIEGIAVGFTITFTIQGVTDSTDPVTLEKTRTLAVTITGAEFTGDSSGVMTVVANNLVGMTQNIAFSSDGSNVKFRLGNITGDGSGSISYGVEMGGFTVAGTHDAGGFPLVASFSGTACTVILRRYTSTPFDMTDYASGPCTTAVTVE